MTSGGWTLAAGSAVALILMGPAPAGAQVSLTRETDMTVGHSTDEATAGGVQVRLFGAVGRGWRAQVEATWAATGVTGSDAFGTSFPYDDRLHVMETYVERTATARGLIFGVRGGRYRTPFGISGRSDHGYFGFARAPLIRYGGNWALSNTALEHGVSVLAGRASLTVEASFGTPGDPGDDPRPRTRDVVVRAQGVYRALVLGVSRLDSEAYREGPWVSGRMRFTGVDARWMRGGVMLRGEWITGQPFDGTSTRGGYVDVIVHRVGMGPVTAVARLDRLDYLADSRSSFLRRYTAGARLRVLRPLAVFVNVVHQPQALRTGRHTAIDVGVTQTLRF
ncbi:MAG: hypothetical protein IT184_01175 [Acidobacteria bacterium]|nr:hypothetical protein [Acidobacteriota bacterium]